MSSWISRLPEDVACRMVIGHGMNAEELAANPRLTRWLAQDLNADAMLPLDDTMFDAACLCVSVQYLQRPVDVFREVARVLRPDAPLVVSFSNRCCPANAVAIWQTLSGADQQRLITAYMRQARFTGLSARASIPPSRSLPFYAALPGVQVPYRTPHAQGEAQYPPRSE
jgi:SAM-dependent methyltransferase